MKKFKYALFYDFHTVTTIPDVGRNFDAERFTDELLRCKVDFLTWHARCNQGNAYYDTKAGKKHPSLEMDMIGELSRCCKKKGITLSVYFNVGLSDEELIAHRDWMVVKNNGVTWHGYDEKNREQGFSGPWARMACYNSPYREHLKTMVGEILDQYDVDGFFFDCFFQMECRCEYCMQKMLDRGIDPGNKEEYRQFTYESTHSFAEELNALIRAKKPDSLLFFNGRPFEEVIHMESHLECECLPTTPLWGYETLPLLAHYMRTVAGDKSVLNMTGRFNDWGDFGGLRTAEALKFDLLYGAANGMRPDIGGHFHPRGDMDQAVFDRIREVYSYMQQFDPWVLDAVNVPEAALVYPRRDGKYYPKSPALLAAVRMLTELKIQFDVVSDFVPWEPYKLLIFPDDVLFTEEYTRRVEAFLAKGGKVLCTGKSALNEKKEKFALHDFPAEFVSELDLSPLYFRPEGALSKGIESLDLSIYASGVEVKAASGSETEMFFVTPCRNFGWDGIRSNYYLAPQEVSSMPFCVHNEKILYIAGEIFTGYGKRAPKQLRTLLDNAIAKLYPERKLRAGSLPGFSRSFVQKRPDGSELVHILSYCPEKRCDAMALEDAITLADTRIALRTDGRKIRCVTLAPSGKELEWKEEGSYCCIQIPRIDGYALIHAEYE